MSFVYIFRGKAATGKTTITDLLSKKTNVAVLRKDDIFDCLSNHLSDNNINNKITYNVLAQTMQTNINNKTDIIVDIGLSDINGFNNFLSKIDFCNCNKIVFYCGCSNIDIWKSRLEKRLVTPKPNQFFISTDEAVNYYLKGNIKLLDNEYYIDSCQPLDDTMNYICKIIDGFKNI